MYANKLLGYYTLMCVVCAVVEFLVVTAEEVNNDIKGVVSIACLVICVYCIVKARRIELLCRAQQKHRHIN